MILKGRGPENEGPKRRQLSKVTFEVGPSMFFEKRPCEMENVRDATTNP